MTSIETLKQTISDTPAEVSMSRFGDIPASITPEKSDKPLGDKRKRIL